MPIPRAEHDLKARPLEELILKFLRDHPTEAYSKLERVMAIEGLAGEVEALVFLSHGKRADGLLANVAYTLTLEGMNRAGTLSASDHGGAVYYQLSPDYLRATGDVGP